MPNANYVSGRAFEYAIMKKWRELGYSATRAAGSHGEWDVFVYKPNDKPIFIQAKIVPNEAALKRLVANFQETTVLSKFYRQVLEVKIKGSSEILSATV